VVRLRARSIRRQTFALFLVAAVAPVIVIGAASIVTIQDGLAQQAAQDDRAIAETGAELVADRMGDLVVGIELLGAHPTLRDALINNTSAGAIRWALTGLAQNQSVFDAAALIGADNEPVARWPMAASWINDADLSMQSFVYVNFTNLGGVWEPEPGVRVVVVSTVIRDNLEEPLAVLVGFANTSRFGPLLVPMAVEQKDVFLFDGAATMIAQIADGGRNSTARLDAVWAAFREGVNASTLSAGALRTGGDNGQVASYAPVLVGNTRWVLVTTQPVAAVYAQTASVFYISLATVALTGVVAAVLARSLARRTVEPVVELTGATRDLGRAQELPAGLLERPDELGNLARSFQEMARQVRAESQAKEELIGRLKELDRLKTSIIDTVSHELRTPITIIRGTAELLEGTAGKGDERLGRSSSRIVQAADQLAYLVDELLEMSQIQAGIAALSRTAVDLNEVVREAARLEESVARRQAVTVDLQLDGALGSTMADRPKLRILVRNLVSNAVKFSNRGGNVVVTTGRDGPSVFVRVKDEGIGVAPDAMGHLFDPFFQADGSSTRTHGGAGVGLAVASSLAKMHGGQLSAESALGKGSTFTASIPYAAPPVD
jgi:signal transduction histidine kinase